MIGMSFAVAASRAIEKDITGHAKRVEKAGIRALNKTVTQGRNQASRVIRKTVNLKAGAVKKQLRVVRARKGKPKATIQSVYKPVPLIEFSGVRQTKRGVSVRMRKDKSRKLFVGAFIATMPSGHKGVFWRVKSSRLPIKELYGPTVHGVFGESITEIIQKTDPILQRILDHEIAYELSK